MLNTCRKKRGRDVVPGMLDYCYLIETPSIYDYCYLFSFIQIFDYPTGHERPASDPYTY